MDHYCCRVTVYMCYLFPSLASCSNVNISLFLSQCQDTCFTGHTSCVKYNTWICTEDVYIIQSHVNVYIKCKQRVDLMSYEKHI